MIFLVLLCFCVFVLFVIFSVFLCFCDFIICFCVFVFLCFCVFGDLPWTGQVAGWCVGRERR